KITDEITLTATADENGSWSVAPDADLPDGSYNVEITASKDGRTSTPVSKNLVVDTTLPTVELDQPSGDKVFTGKPEFSGTATPGATVTVKITEEITLTATADENGSWNVAPDADLPDGSYNVEITASKDGKTSTPVSKNFTVENVDKTALKQKIDEIQGKITAGEWTDSDYTIESWANLSRALEEAVDVFNDPNAAQEAVDQALATLQQAELDLVKLNGELQELNLVGLTDDGEQAITLSPEFDPNQYNHYSGTVTSDVYGISINPSALYPNDTTVAVSLNDTEVPVGQWDNLPLRDGKNTIVVTVKDKNGELLNQYTIEIDRLAVIADNKLQSLVPSVGSLSPSFDPNRDSYTMSVANRVNQLQLTPTVFDSNAKIEIRGIDGSWQEVTSGNTSDYLALNVGSNTIIVKVTGQDGNVKEYTLTVTRASNSGGGIVIPWTPSESPEDIVSTVNDSSASFASGTATQTGTTVTVDPDKLSSILAGANEQKLAIHSPNEGNLQVDGLMADALKQMADTGTNLNISNPLAIYPIPSGKMDLGGVSKQLDDAALNDIAVHVAIARSSDALIESAKSNAIEQGYELLVTPVDLDLTFTKDGKTVKSEQLNGYAPKYIALPEGIDPNRITTGVIVNPDGSVYHVPTVVTKLDSRYYALINDLRSSGTYSVIWNPQDFDDVRSHWGREDINNIAARLDLQGNGDNTFSPNRIVTRSEFAEIVVLGLDLMNQDAPQTNFSDVPTSAWYKDSVAIADEFTIVEGYSDGHFRGDQQITREQGFAMIARAYRLVQSEGAPDQEQIALALDQYSDGADVSNWAKADVAQLIHAGIIQGNGPEVLSPKAQMTRAEVAALIARMLKVTDLIDK
ncbi:S-layer homology domain-containing protein, partial [Marinicrinis lubricantis]